MLKIGLIFLYVAAIVIANIVTANEPPLTFTWLDQTWVVTWGTWFIAATFILRDAVQLAAGRAIAYGAIALALLANVVLSLHYTDLFWVTVGSAFAFGLSESFDTEVFTRLRRRLSTRMAVSGVAGGALDSIVFAIVGLSPLTTNIVPWEFLWTTVVAQIVVKCGASIIAGMTLAAAEDRLAEAHA